MYILAVKYDICWTRLVILKLVMFECGKLWTILATGNCKLAVYPMSFQAVFKLNAYLLSVNIRTITCNVEYQNGLFHKLEALLRRTSMFLVKNWDFPGLNFVFKEKVIMYSVFFLFLFLFFCFLFFVCLFVCF